MPPSQLPLYLDAAATTRVAPEVCAAMMEVLGGSRGFANPSSGQHLAGRDAAAIVDRARAEVATELGCLRDEVIFTSGATESINLALRGVALAHADQGRHLVTTKIEHKATLACCEALIGKGFEVTFVSPGADGRVAPDAIAAALRPDTLLVSVMHTNNETGVMQPVEAIAELLAERGVLLHVDAAQAAGKFRIDLGAVPIDLLSLSAHKFHGPKGAGSLAIRDRSRLRLRPLNYGGGQEFSLRPGTEPTHQIVGLSVALTLAARGREADLEHLRKLRGSFLDALACRLPITIHGDLKYASPYILNFSIPGVRSDALINQSAAEVAIGSGSACSSGTVDPSHVLRAMGVEGDDLYGAVRVSFDRYHTEDDVLHAARAIVAAAKRILDLEH
jgi:cysteine desulfurase